MAYDGTITLSIEIDKGSLKKTQSTVEKASNQMGEAFKNTGKSIESALSAGNAKSAKLITQMQKSNLEIEKQSRKISELKAKLEGLQSGDYLPSNGQLDKLKKGFDDTTESIKKTQLEIERLRNLTDQLEAQAFKSPDTGMAVFTDQQEAEFQNAINRLDALEIKLEQDKQKANELGSALTSATGIATQAEISKTNTQLADAEVKLNAARVRSEELGQKMKKSFASGMKGVENFGKRIGRLAASALVFSAITKALTALRDLFGQALMSNEEFNQAITDLKAALTVLATPLYNVILPVLKTVINYLTTIIMQIVKLYAQISGKSVESLMANAKALKAQSDAYKQTGKAAKTASRGVASFDEVNSVSNSGSSEMEAGAASSAGLDTSGLTAGVSEAMTQVFAIISGALLALGVILLCFGQIAWGLGLIVIGLIGLYAAMAPNSDGTTNSVKQTISTIAAIAGGALLALGLILVAFGQIPMGIALLAVGALTLVAAYAANKDTMTNDVKKTITTITVIAGEAMLALGIILIACGQIPIGIALLAVGALSLVAAYAINKNSMTDEIKQTVSTITAIVGAALLALGIILVCCGVLPLGIALIAAGAVSLVTVIAVNKNAIVDWIKGVWDSIKNFWNQNIAPWFTVEKWKELAGKIGTGLKNGFIAAINGIISLFESGVNFIVKMLNKLSFDVPDWVPLIGGKKFGFNLKEVHIPRLAQGAVLPANRPFLAQLGDQKNGTNLETPESLLRQIYAEENAPMIVLMQQMLEVLKRGTSIQIDGREILMATRNAENRAGRQTVTGGFANVY